MKYELSSALAEQPIQLELRPVPHSNVNKMWTFYLLQMPETGAERLRQVKKLVQKTSSKTWTPKLNESKI